MEDCKREGFEVREDGMGEQPDSALYKMEFRRKAWKPAAIAWWNAMPESLRADCSPSSFKWNLRSWVRGNIDLKK